MGDIKKPCKICGKVRAIRAHQIGKNNYCSRECYVKDITGKENLKVRGEKHGQWRGKNAAYSSIHEWISKKKGKASGWRCAFCKKQAMDWANVNHQYSRNLYDYLALCRKCHIHFDKNKKNTFT